jgi:hypothetical protein
VPASECRVVIASVPDRERVVAEIWIGECQFAELEIWIGECQFAELRSEGEELLVEVYPHPRLPSWELPYQDLMELLVGAKTRLLGTSAHDSKLSME